jgi:hypothetical protein
MSVPFAEVGAGVFAGYEAEKRGLLHPSHPAGVAGLLAIFGFLFLAFTLRNGRGLLRGAASALGFLALVAAAEMPIHYLARAYAESHPDSALAAGVGLDL